VDRLTDRPAAANLPLAVDADRLRRMSSAWSSYPRKTLFKYKLHQDTELFERAYGYIREYY